MSSNENSIVDEEAYIRYLELSEEIDNDPDKIYQTSNPLLKVNLTSTVFIIQKQIKKLPEEEQKIILDKSSYFRGKLIQLGHLKTKAFGSLRVKKDNNGDPIFNVRQTELLELFGKFYSIAEVHKICIDQWNTPITPGQLKAFYEANRNKIEELKKEYEQDYSDVRLGHRRSRLDELSWIYSSTKDKYVKYEARDDAKLMLQILDQVKKEVDGDLVINAKLKIDIEQTINIQIQQEMIKEFNITAYIIAKMAGKLNINPLFLLSRLANSHYAKFTGFTATTKEEMDTADIYSPTGIAYNWEEIIAKNTALVEDDKVKSLLPEIPGEVKVIQNNEEKVVSNKSIIEIMKEKIAAQKSGFEQIKDLPINRDNI